MAENASDAGQVIALSAEFADLTQQLDADVDRWAELAERA